MGGPGSGGHNRKPKAILQLQGALRTARHADMADDVLAIGQPIKPDGLPPYADAMWEHVIRSIHPDILAESDTSSLEGMCHWYSVWRSHILSIDASELRIAAAAWDRFAAVSIRFGMSPVDRTKIKLTAKPNRKKDPMEELLG